MQFNIHEAKTQLSRIIERVELEVYVSAVTVWELATKASLILQAIPESTGSPPY